MRKLGWWVDKGEVLTQVRPPVDVLVGTGEKKTKVKCTLVKATMLTKPIKCPSKPLKGKYKAQLLKMILGSVANSKKRGRSSNF